MLSVKDVVIEMRMEEEEEEEEEKRKNGEGQSKKKEENEIQRFHEKIRKSYLEKLDFLKKQLLN